MKEYGDMLWVFVVTCMVVVLFVGGIYLYHAE